MSRGGTKWFRKPEYKEVRPPFEMGDGSVCEVVAHPDKGGRWLQIQRVWPCGVLQTVDLLPPESPFGETKYGFVSEGPANTEPKPKLDERLGSGHYRPPYAITSSVPGNKPGDDLDPGTGKRFPSRAEFNQYYKEHHLEKAGSTDIANMSIRTTEPAPSAENAKSPQIYDVTKGPSVPPEFQGKKFHYSSSSR